MFLLGEEEVQDSGTSTLIDVEDLDEELINGNPGNDKETSPSPVVMSSRRKQGNLRKRGQHSFCNDIHP